MATRYQAGYPNERIWDYDYVFGWRERDKKLLAKLQDFIPDKVFDAHCHLHRAEDFPGEFSGFRAYGTADAKRCLADQKEIYGDRKFRALLLATPSVMFNAHPEWRLEMNAWMNKQMEDAPECVGTIYVMPQDTKEDIEAMITHPNIRGFKCYHQSAITEGETWYATVDQYLPEAAWEVANERGMSITIHMVRPLALADDSNRAYFKKMTAKYPNAKLILAHCARCFASWTNLNVLEELKGIPNIYFDMGAVCDPFTIAYLIKTMGPDHVMWATDYFIDRMHGRTVNCSDSFVWVYEHEIPADMLFENNDTIQVCKTVLESLLAFYQASLMLDMSREDIEKVFYYTACNLYGLKDE